MSDDTLRYRRGAHTGPFWSVMLMSVVPDALFITLSWCIWGEYSRQSLPPPPSHTHHIEIIVFSATLTFLPLLLLQRGPLEVEDLLELPSCLALQVSTTYTSRMIFCYFPSYAESNTNCIFYLILFFRLKQLWWQFIHHDQHWTWQPE